MPPWPLNDPIATPCLLMLLIGAWDWGTGKIRSRHGKGG